MSRALLSSLVAACLSASVLPAATLEYFWNNEPGLGNATQVDIDDPTGRIALDSLDIVAPSTPGHHELFIRLAYESDNWGPTYPAANYTIKNDYAPQQLASTQYRIRNAAGDIVHTSPDLTLLPPGNAFHVEVEIDTGELSLPEGDYTLEIIATNQTGYTTTRHHPLTLSASPNQPPILKFLSPPLFDPIEENETSSAGTLISDLIAQLGAIQSSDPNNDPLSLALSALDFTRGDWEYQSLEQTSWHALNPPPKGSAFTLLPTDRIRFIPDADYSKTIPQAIHFHLWDQYAGAEHELLETSSTAGQNTLSQLSGYASLPINPLPDVPIVTEKTDYQAPSNGSALRLDLTKIFDAPTNSTLTYKLESVEKPELFEKYGIAPKAAELVLYPRPGQSGNSAFALSATDQSDNKATANLDIEVVSKNLPPTFRKIPSLKLDTSTPSQSIKLAEFVSNPDSPSDPLTYSVLQPRTELLQSVSLDPTTGELSLHAAKSQLGTTTLALTVTDKAGNRASQSLLVSVSTNPIPIVNDPDFHKSLDLKLSQTAPKPGKTNPIEFSFRGDLGATYQLQKSTNMKEWTGQESITIADTRIRGNLSGKLQPGDASAFWRIIKTADGVPLAVSEIIATYADSGINGVLLQIENTSREQLESVVFYDGSVELGNATPLGDGRWAFTAHSDPATPKATEIYAIAHSTEDHQTISSTTRILLANPAQFVALDPNGTPDYGALISLNEDGSLPAFRYFPIGADPTNPLLWLDFPAGTRLEQIAGRKQLIFEAAQLTLASNPSQPFAIPAGSLPTGMLHFDHLETLLGDTVSDGIPLLLWQRQAILWTGGPLPTTLHTVAEPPKFKILSTTPVPELETSGAPPPPSSGRNAVYEKSWYGEFTLPEAQAKLIATAQNPLWLTLHPNGSFLLKGAVQVELPNGARFKGSLHFAHPRYTIRIGAESVEIPALGSLAEILPDNPESCIPNTTTPDAEELGQLYACLDSYRLAYQGFAAAAGKNAFEDTGKTTDGFLDTNVNLATSALDAWAHSLAAQIENNLNRPIEAVTGRRLSDLFGTEAKSAIATGDPAEVAETLAALSRIQKSIRLDTGSNYLNIDTAKLTGKIDSLRTAFLKYIVDPTRPLSYEQFNRVAKAFIDIEGYREATGLDSFDTCLAELSELIDSYSERYELELGLRVAAPDPEDPNKTIIRNRQPGDPAPAYKSMNRFELHFMVRRGIQIEGTKSALGSSSVSCLAEAADMLDEVAELIEADLDIALKTKNRRAVLMAAHDMLQIEAARAAAGSAADSSIAEIISAMEAFPAPAPGQEARDFLVEARFIVHILKQITSEAIAQTFGEKQYTRLSTLLDDLFETFPQYPSQSREYTPVEIVEIIELGLLRDRLYRSRNYGTGNPNEGWTSGPNPRLAQLISQLAAGAGATEDSSAERNWTALDRAAELISQEASLISEEYTASLDSAHRDNLNTRRFQLLSHSASLLSHYRFVAVADWNAGAANLGTHSSLTDLLLPGDIRFQKLAGAATFDVETGYFSGAFSGEVQLPKFDTTLIVPNGSFDTLGNLAFSIYGDTRFPGSVEGDFTDSVRFTVQKHRPLSFNLNSAGEIQVGGSARLALPNGMFLEAYLNIADPEFLFGAKAGGIEFALVNSIRLGLPHLDREKFESSFNNSNALSEYYSALLRSLNLFANRSPDLPSPNFNDIGQPPHFATPELNIKFDSLNTWAAMFSTNLEDAINSGFNNVAIATKAHVIPVIETGLVELRAAKASMEGISGQIDYFQKLAALSAPVARALKNEAKTEAAGLSGESAIADLTNDLDEARQFSRTELDKLQVSSNSFPHVIAIASSALELEAQYAAMGGNTPGLANLGRILNQKLAEIETALLERYGINTQTVEVSNRAKYNTLSEAEFRFLVRNLTRMKALAQTYGDDFVDLGVLQGLLQLRFKELAREDNENTPPELRRNETPEQKLKRKINAMYAWNRLEATFGAAAEDYIDLNGEVEIYQNELRIRRPELTAKQIQLETGKTIARINLAIANEKKAADEEFRQLEIAAASEKRALNSALENREARNPLYKFFNLLVTYAENSGNTSANKAAFTSLDAYLKRQIEIISESELDTQDIAGAANFTAEALDTLIFAIEFVGIPIEGFTPTFDVSVPKLQLNPIQRRFEEYVEASEAFWLAKQHLDVVLAAYANYKDALEEEAKSVLALVALDTLYLADDVLGLISVQFDALEDKQYVLSLPGNITLERIFGELAFNRETEIWQVKLGGRLSFPEIKDRNGAPAYFEVLDSTFHRTDGFSLQLKALAPIVTRMGGEEVELIIDGGFNLSGSWSGQINSTKFAAEIQRDTNGTIETYAAEILYAYDPSAQEHKFGIGLEFTDDIKFGNDVVVFKGEFSTDVTAQENENREGPDFTSATYHTGAKVGILNKNTTFPENYDPKPEDFKLLFTGEVVLGTFASGDVRIALREGNLELPEGFQSQACGSSIDRAVDPDAPRASVNINDLEFNWINAEQEVHMNGSIALADIRFGIEGFEAVWIDVCSMSLNFEHNDIFGPSEAEFSDVNAVINIPLPNGRYTRAELNRGSWTLGGYPNFDLSLVNDINLFNIDPFSLELLGQNELGHPNTALSFRDRTVTLTGFARSKIAGMFKNATGDPIDLIGGNSAVLQIQLPEEGSFPVLEDIAFLVEGIEIAAQSESELYLGEAGEGLFVINPRLRLENPLGIFAAEFGLDFDFGVGVTLSENGETTGETVALSTSGSRIVFSQDAGSPFFLPGKTCYTYGAGHGDEAESKSLLGEDDLPLTVRELCLDFRSPSSESGYFSLFPENGQPFAVFDASNIGITLSADLNIAEIITGAVDDLELRMVDGKPTASVNGLGFGVDLTDTIGFPASGNVYIGGLQHFPQIFLSGKITVNVKGNAVDGIGVFDAAGLRGICFGLAGSEINIPLPYGFTLNGGQGGIAFGNFITDPCDFKNHFPINPNTGAPLAGSVAPDLPLPDLSSCSLITWEQLLELRDDIQNTGEVSAASELAIKRYRMERILVLEFNMSSGDAESALEGLSAEEMDTLLADLQADSATTEPQEGSVESFTLCPDPSNCPPAALGIAGQPHPESFVSGSEYEGRNIFKFTSIDEATLNTFGVTPERVTSIVGPGSNKQLAANIAHTIVAGLGGVIPRPPDDFPDQTIAETINDGITETLQEIELGFANTLVCAIDATETPDNAEDLYLAIVKAAYAGVPYTDAVIKISGEFSYTGVSSFASVTGGMIQSTNGSAGLVGDVKLFGVPVGGAELYLNRFDAYGNLNAPNLCGKIDAKIGPLDLGSAALLFDCPGCVEKAFRAVENTVNSLSSQYVYDIMRRLERDYPALSPNPNYSPLEHLNLLESDDQRQAFLGNLISLPPTDSFGNYAEAYLAFLSEMANAIIPRLSTCGAVQPKLFGIPLTGGNDAYAFKGYAGPKNIDPDAVSEGVTLIESVSFAPSKVFAHTALAGMGIPPNTVTELLFPAFDQATASLRFELPAPGTLVRDQLTMDPVEFAETRLRDILGKSVFTFEYKMSPWGLELGRAGGRILMPSFDHHPEGRSSFFSKANRFGPAPSYDSQLEARGLPSRLQVLLAALGDPGNGAPNVLADPSWSGKGPEDFDLIFANTDFEGTFDNDTNLTDHFFPHGGFLGASSLSLPKIITRGLPSEAATLATPGQNLETYLTAAQSLLDYVFHMEQVGELGFYIPAPNPPVAEFPSSVQELIDQVSDFQLDADFSSYYPADKTFMKGWIDTPILGIPTALSSLELDGNAGTLNIHSEIPTGSWFSSLIGQATIDFAIAPGEQIEHDQPFWKTYKDVFNNPDTAASNIEKLARDILKGNASNASKIVDLIRTLPKVSATLSGHDLTIPNPLDPDSSLAAVADASLEIYSPYFNKTGADGNNALDLARRNGGIAFSGDLDIGEGFFSAPNIEFALTPPDPATPGGYPTIASSFELNTMPIASLFDANMAESTFSGDLLLSPEEGRLELSSVTPYISVPGLGKLYPKPGEESIRARFNAEADYPNKTWSHFDISINPGEFKSPFFAESLQLLVHGRKEDSPFSFSATGEWNASAHFEGSGGLVLGFDQSQPWVEIEPSQSDWTQDASISVSNTGLSISNVPIGTTISFTNHFPVTELRGKEVTTGGAGSISLEVGEDSFSLLASIDDTLAFGSRFDIRSGFDLQISNDRIYLAGELSEIGLDDLVSIKPNTGDSVGFSYERTNDGNNTFTIQPAQLELWAYGPRQTFGIDGGSPTTPFTFSTAQEWNARITLDELSLDPDGPFSVANPILTISPSHADDSLIDGQINGNGFERPSFSITRQGLIDITWFPGQGSRQSTFTNVDPGAIRFRLNDSGFDLRVSSPGDMFDFANLPALDFPENVTITSNGLTAAIQTAANFSFPTTASPRLLEIAGNAAGTLDINTDGYDLTLDPPNIEILGIPISSDSISEISFHLGGNENDLRLQLSTTSDIGLLGSDILELKAGTHTFTGNLDFESGDNRLAASLDAQFNLRYPNPHNLGTYLRRSIDLALSFDTAGEMQPLVVPTNRLPEFDLGWIDIDRGSLILDYQRTPRQATGTFTLAATGWDIELFGNAFNDVGMSINSAGRLELTNGGFPATTLNIGSGLGQMLLSVSDRIPFYWDLSSGHLGLDLPDDISLTLPHPSFLSGSFDLGIPLPDFPEINADGSFDFTFVHNGFALNGARIGNVLIEFSRAAGKASPIVFEIANDQFTNNAILSSLTFNLRATTDGSFDSYIDGELGVPLNSTFFGLDTALLNSFDDLDGRRDSKLTFGSVDLAVNLAAILEFKGDVEILDNEFEVTLSTGSSCVDFNLGPLDPPSSCFTLPNLNPVP